jgi:LemA protein
MANTKLGGTGTIIVIAVLLVIILVISIALVSTYNNFVKLNTEADNKWAYVQTVYQERFDLIPRIVQSVTAQTKAEKEILEGIANARTNYMNAKTPDGQVAAAQQLDNVFLKLNALTLTENYPNVQFAQAFSDFRTIYEGQENRIRVERNRYNEAIKEYNVAVLTFPGNFMAGMFGFQKRTMFEAQQGAETAPDLNFNV